MKGIFLNLFEKKKDKRNEFPDAFIVEYLNNLIKNTLDYKIHFISKDKGIKQALDEKIEKYTTIEEFLTKINGIDLNNYSDIKQIIEEDLPIISLEVLSRLDTKCTFIQSEEIEIDSIEFSKDFNINILSVDKNKIYINCKFSKISLLGSFICLDHENSYWPNDEKYYVYTKYLKADKIDIENFEMSVTINNINKVYSLEYDNIYTIELTYENIKEFANDSFGPFEDNYVGDI